MKRIVVVLLACFTLAFATSALAQPRKVDVCHATDTGSYFKINISRNALPAHVKHGDAQPGEPVPGKSGYEFDEDCAVVLSQPNFVPFNIRNANGTINDGSSTFSWDATMSIVENTDGDGFSAVTSAGGQKVGYGTNFFDNVPIREIETVNWVRVAGNITNPGKAPYLNIWVTDGTNFAIIASEFDGTYGAYPGTDFSTRPVWKVFETNFSNLGWLCSTGPAARGGDQYLYCNSARATFADIPANVTILSPTSYPAPNIGTGAPRGGFGFNLIFGDTAANFVGSFTLESLSITTNGITYYPR